MSIEPASATELPPIVLSSSGVVLIYGCDAAASEAGQMLEDFLDVSVLMHADASAIPSRTFEFPVARGLIRSAKGHLGAFELVVDRYAAPAPAPAAHGLIAFGSSRDNAVSRCDIILDLSGGTALFPAPDLRDGYLRADPRHRDGWLTAVSKARD